MLEFFRRLFGTDFMPHIYCLRGDPAVLWLQVISDLVVALSYYAIPFVLLRVVLKRREPLFRRLAVLFVLFIGACGTTHLLEVWTIWQPMYRLEAVVKGATALLSAATALALLKLEGSIAALPSIAELEREIELRRKAEEAEREKDQRFRSFVESVEDYAIYMLDTEGMVRTWNHGAERLLGYTSEEVVGQSFSRFYTPEDQALGRPQEALRVTRQTGRFAGEGWRVRKDGTRFLAHVVLRPIYDTAGVLNGFSKVTRDLTESRELEAKYQMLLEAVPDAIVIVAKDGRVDFINVQAERLFGYRRDEIVGRSVEVLVPPRARERQDNYRQHLMEYAHHPSAAGPADIYGLHKNGTEIPLDFTVSPLETREGRVLLFALRDLTEQRQMEKRFRTLLESAPDAIILYGKSERIVFMNRRAEELFGYNRTELVGEPVATLIPERLLRERAVDREAGTGASGPDSGSGLSTAGEAQICRRKDGSEIFIEANITPIETREGLVTMASIRDVTEKRRGEERFRALMNAAPDGILLMDRQGRILVVNERMESLFGYERGELIGKDVAILSPEELRARQTERRRRFFQDPEGFVMDNDSDLSGLRKDGSLFYVEANFRSYKSSEGTVAVVAVRDVTERKRSERRFRALLEAVPDAIVMIDREGTIQYVNHQAEAMYGRSSRELLGQPGDLLVPERIREERRSYRDRLMSGELVHPPVEMGMESIGLRKDGSEFPTEFSFSPLETAEGQMFLYMIRDTTERRRSEARFRALLESAPDAMVIVNAEGTMELINFQTEKLFGYQREELIGRSVDLLVPEPARGTHGLHRDEFFAAPQVRQMGVGLDLKAVRKDGSEFPIEVSLSPLEGPAGLSVTATIRDITARRQAAERLAETVSDLRHSNEALEQFAHIASHDLQEPLRMVASYVQLLARRYQGRLDADADEFIEFAVDGTRRMKRLIEDLLLYSRAGKGGPPVTRFDPADALQEALNNLHTAIQESEALVTWEPLPVVEACRSELVQIFQNLIGNAVKYRSERRPEIHVSGRAQGREWLFSVADNGIGIQPEYFERIFVVFQRLHSRGEYQGTGIGLAICKRILQQQGGRIWVESEPGRGSVFHFSLPMR